MKTPEELFQDLQPWMNRQFKDGRLLREANARLLGRKGYDGEGPDREATGLHKYGENHLQPDWNGIRYAREEVIDAINQVGPMTQMRIDNGLEAESARRTMRRRFAISWLNFALNMLSLMETEDGSRGHKEQDRGQPEVQADDPDRDSSGTA